MDLPLEITYQGLDRTDALDRLIARQAQRLERFHPHITSCRVGISKPHRNKTNANPFRVRIRCTVPPGHELLAVLGQADSDPLLRLPAVVRGAFGVLERKLKVVAEKQNGAGRKRVAAKRTPATPRARARAK
jgi:hypothetical protein